MPGEVAAHLGALQRGTGTRRGRHLRGPLAARQLPGHDLLTHAGQGIGQGRGLLPLRRPRQQRHGLLAPAGRCRPLRHDLGGEVVVIGQGQLVAAELGQVLDEPQELAPRSLAADEVEQVQAQLGVQVVLDGAAVAFDQLDDAPESPGLALIPKCTVMSRMSRVRTGAGAGPNTSMTAR